MRLRPNYLSAGAACACGAALAAVGLVAHREALAVVAAPVRFFHTAVGALVGRRGSVTAGTRGHLGARLVAGLVIHVQLSPFRSTKRYCSLLIKDLFAIVALPVGSQY